MTPEELRRTICETTLENGGHLASSLGAVEIAMALAEVFDPMRDRVVWDVGHQAYAWKLMTGRADKFHTLRRFGGLSGFPNPKESPADAAVAGHAGVALSVAEGLAFARDRRHGDENVIAVVGDAALANGTSFEALNNCVDTTGKVIIVLNDNEMSISSPTGAVSRLLGRIISGVRYNRIKAAAEAAGHRLRLTFLRDAYHRFESRVKGLFLGSAFFERLGVRYIGPVDGHNLSALKAAFTVAKNDKRSVLVHVVTVKGKGYPPAEADPARWHGVSPRPASPAESAAAGKTSWSAAAGAALCELARSDERVCALTAAMKHGTGLTGFAEQFPERFVDVGIAEGHMVALSAGMAAGGMRPFVAVYSTFLQRAVDQVMHDVCISNLPVVFLVDRAGVVGEDGATHHGIYDLAMLRCLPNLTVCQPSCAGELARLMREALGRDGPTVIRYPRGAAPARVDAVKRKGAKIAIWATGDMLPKANAVAEMTGATVVYADYIKPFDAELLRRQRESGMLIASIENGAVAGGFGESIGADMRFGWPDAFIQHGSVDELERAFSLDAESIAAAINARAGLA
ncbi:MAG: 1-deoxy-D-xylulose-5-phosphate synthase [Kiritimatiellae bacterium]|nr:1-deoxy-D-xylulose-5-phosphate synthase [Kiritimatiellia bacterium]